jgi:hypothetical protein
MQRDSFEDARHLIGYNVQNIGLTDDLGNRQTPAIKGFTK